MRRETAVPRAGDYQPCAADPCVMPTTATDPTDVVLVVASLSGSDSPLLRSAATSRE
jgi:hypothetical protein